MNCTGCGAPAKNSIRNCEYCGSLIVAPPPQQPPQQQPGQTQQRPPNAGHPRDPWGGGGLGNTNMGGTPGFIPGRRRGRIIGAIVGPIVAMVFLFSFLPMMCDIFFYGYGCLHDGWFTGTNASIYVEVDRDSLQLNVGQSGTISASVQGTTDRRVLWTTDDHNIASVHNGSITAHSIGSVIIRAMPFVNPSSSVAVQISVSIIEGGIVPMVDEFFVTTIGQNYDITVFITLTNNTGFTRNPLFRFIAFNVENQQFFVSGTPNAPIAIGAFDYFKSYFYFIMPRRYGTPRRIEFGYMTF